MTRESRARVLALATGVLVVLLAALFAALRNLTPAPEVSGPAAAPTADDVRAAGREAFVALGCAACHAAEGRGNASLPLDGVGARLGRAQLHAAAFGTDAALPAPVAAIKRARANDARADVLLDYLERLD